MEPRERVKRIFLKYDPPKLEVLDDLLGRFKGKEQDLVNSLVKKYGPEPDPSEPLAKSKTPPRTPPTTSLGGASSPSGTFAASPSSGAFPPASSNPSAAIQRLTQALTTFYEKHDPSKVSAAAQMAEKFVGKESQLQEAVKKKYGEGFELPPMESPRTPRTPVAGQNDAPQPLPSTPEEQQKADALTERLRLFFQHHDPSKAGTAVSIANKYWSKPDAIMAKLVKKYGPEPSPADLATSSSSASMVLQPSTSTVLDPSAAASGADAEKIRDLEDRIRVFYTKYDPSKVADAGKLAAKYCLKEKELFNAMQKKYGDQPPASGGGTVAAPSAAVTTKTAPQEAPPAATATAPAKPTKPLKYNDTTIPLEKRLTAFYTKHDKSKLPEVGTIAAKYSVNENSLWNAIFKKYNVAPPSPMQTSLAAEETAAEGEQAPSGAVESAAPSTAPLSPRNEPALPPSALSKGKKEKKAVVTVVSTEDRNRLINFFRVYDAPRQAEIDSLMTQYEKKEAELFKTLVAQYGPEPPPYVPTEEDKSALEKRLKNFFIKYDGARLAEVPRMVDQYVGKEFDVFKSLVTRYGPEPEVKAPVVVPQLSIGVPDLPAPVTRTRSRARSVKISTTPERERLIAFFTAYDQSRLVDVDQLLAEHEGEERKLMEQLAAEYGVALETKSNSSGEATPAAGATPRPTPEDEERLRRRLRAFYRRYDEGRLADLDGRVERYLGHEAELFEQLVAQYGPEPESEVVVAQMPEEVPQSTMGLDQAKLRISRVLTRYDPRRLEALDQLLETFKDREESLLQSMVEKYGAEPLLEEDLSPYLEVAAKKSAEEEAKEAEEEKLLQRTPFEWRLHKFYERFDKGKVPNIPQILEQFDTAAKRSALLSALHAKYGPELLSDDPLLWKGRKDPARRAPRSLDGELFWRAIDYDLVLGCTNDLDQEQQQQEKQRLEEYCGLEGLAEMVDWVSADDRCQVLRRVVEDWRLLRYVERSGLTRLPRPLWELTLADDVADAAPTQEGNEVDQPLPELIEPIPEPEPVFEPNPLIEAPPAATASGTLDEYCALVVQQGEWVEKKDPKTAKAYFYNPKTRETTWTLPKKLQPQWEEAQKKEKEQLEAFEERREQHEMREEQRRLAFDKTLSNWRKAQAQQLVDYQTQKAEREQLLLDRQRTKEEALAAAEARKRESRDLAYQQLPECSPVEVWNALRLLPIYTETAVDSSPRGFLLLRELLQVAATAEGLPLVGEGDSLTRLEFPSVEPPSMPSGQEPLPSELASLAALYQSFLNRICIPMADVAALFQQFGITEASEEVLRTELEQAFQQPLVAPPAPEIPNSDSTVQQSGADSAADTAPVDQSARPSQGQGVESSVAGGEDATQTTGGQLVATGNSDQPQQQLDQGSDSSAAPQTAEEGGTDEEPPAEKSFPGWINLNFNPNPYDDDAFKSLLPLIAAEEEETGDRSSIEYDEYLGSSTLRSEARAKLEDIRLLESLEKEMRNPPSAVVESLPSVACWYEMLEPYIHSAMDSRIASCTSPPNTGRTSGASRASTYATPRGTLATASTSASPGRGSVSAERSIMFEAIKLPRPR